MLVIGGYLPDRLCKSQFEIVRAIMITQYVDLIGDCCVATTFAAANNPDQVLDGLRLLSDLRIG